MCEILIKILLCLSCLFSAALIVKLSISFVKYLKRKFSGKSAIVDAKYTPLKSRLLVDSMLLVGAVWCLRFTVGYYLIFHHAEDAQPLTWMEEIFNSIVHTMQTFSLDEDYASYITSGRAMMSQLFGEGSWLVGFYGIYAAVLNFLVPFAGGAILLELISELSPHVRLWFANRGHWTEKYYFSELNENSLALAKSIITFKRRNICIIFTDAYGDKDEEQSLELMAKAKAMGAICIKDDLMHIKLHGIIKQSKIFLIDESENANLQTLAALLEINNPAVKKSEIYVFASDSIRSDLDEEVQFMVNKKIAYQYAGVPDKKRKVLEKKAYESLSEEEKKAYKEKWTDEKKAILHKFYFIKNSVPTVIPVNSVRNMIVNLFSDGVPLYEPIIDKKADENGKKSLNLTIIGSGVIGTEVFLNAYWYGQLLDCRLNITVVSKEKMNKESSFSGPGDFEGRINNINPDILQTAQEGSPLLKYADDKAPGEPYFRYDYKECDVLSDDFKTLMDNSGLLDTDYFVVALGSDEENFTVANKLRQTVGEYHLFSAPENKTVISYVVYNSDLACALNKDNKHRYSLQSETADIIMYAFGSLDSVYSIGNVFFAGKTNKEYSSMKPSEKKKKSLNEKEHKNDKIKLYKDIYSYQADLARGFHRKYQEYAAGFHTVSMFAAENEETECRDVPADKYKEFVVCEKIGSNKTKDKLNGLAWMEHRRWCAYMRIKGYRNLNASKGEDFSKYFSKVLPEHSAKEHKFVSLKLHPCLVEFSREDGILADMDEYGFIIEKTEFEFEKDGKTGDYLDQLSLSRHKLDPSREDFKRWDYPEHALSKEEVRTYKQKR